MDENKMWNLKKINVYVQTVWKLCELVDTEQTMQRQKLYIYYKWRHIVKVFWIFENIIWFSFQTYEFFAVQLQADYIHHGSFEVQSVELHGRHA